MRAVFTADLHGRLPKIEPCDVLVIAGDICPDHPSGKLFRYSLPDNGASWQADWMEGEFWAWCDGVPADTILMIWGNHDFVGEPVRFGGRSPALHPKVVLLEDQTTVLHGIKFYGTPWVPGLPRWAFYGSDNACRARAGAIPRNVDVLISHGPPYGVADFVDPQYGSVHVGDKWLKEALNTDLKPRLVVCGHIHEQYGKHLVPGERPVEIWNVSHVNTSYEPVNPPMVLDILDDDEAWSAFAHERLDQTKQKAPDSI